LEIAEKERGDLVKKKEEIFRLASEMLEIEHDRGRVLEIRKGSDRNTIVNNYYRYVF